jgi:hypothetical protein
VVFAGITKIFRAAGLAKTDAPARLGLTDLARIEKRSHLLSPFLETPNSTAFISGARLTRAQQSLWESNPHGIAVARIEAMAGFLKEDLGLPVESEVHFFCNRKQVPLKRVAERKESKARLPISPYVLICLEAAANVDFRIFRSREPGCPGSWRAERYDGMACDGDGPSPMANLSSHVRIQVEVVLRLLRCRNPAMVVDLARSWYVAAVLASGRGADASGMSVKEFRAGRRPRSPDGNPASRLTHFSPRFSSTRGGAVQFRSSGYGST